jgi:DNA ligase D-like protein (predicted ligase)
MTDRQSSARPPEPALAKLTHDRFYEPGWVYERKLDGERCLATRTDGRVRLWSRSGRDVSGSFPEIVDALAEQDIPDIAVDGEVVAFEGPRTSFARLQPRIQVSDPDRARASGVRVFYYLFDVLEVDGKSVRKEELRARKRLLRDLLTYRDPLRFTAHRVKADEDYYSDACRRGWEGLIAKKADAPYVAGRSGNWLKFKCESGQEFVIGGFTDPERSRAGFGALLLGYYKGKDLVYAGKVGTGFSDSFLRSLRRRMDEIEADAPAFTKGKLPTAHVHWLQPELVGEVAFTEWTSAGQLRHPRFQGLRRDKQAADVVRE